MFVFLFDPKNGVPTKPGVTITKETAGIQVISHK